MAIIVRVAHTSKRGASGGTRYMAERDFDLERESRETRQLFSAREDNLTSRSADRFLAGDADRLNMEDLHQVIISMLPEDFERLGDTDLERVAALREVTREAMESLSTQDLKGYESRWVGVAHLHTKLPHVHLLLHKEITDPITGEKRTLKTIPRELLAARGSTLNDEDPARLGRISQRFRESLDKHSKPFRHVEIRDESGATPLRREVIDGSVSREYKPTPEEVIVGRWLAAEANAARAKDAGGAPPVSLREYVKKLDEQSFAKEQTQVPAFLSRTQISDLMRYRTSDFQLTFQVMPYERVTERERSYRERLDRDFGRDAPERQTLQRARNPEDNNVRPPQLSKDAPVRGTQLPEHNGSVHRQQQLPLKEEGRAPYPAPLIRADVNEPSAKHVIGNENATHTRPHISFPRSFPEDTYGQKKLKEQEDLLESRGRVLVQKYLALSINPSQVKEFAKASKDHVEAGHHVDSLVKNFRERYGADPPTGTILSSTDRDSLVKNAPGLRHLPGSVRNELVREAIAAKPSDHARSYLPKEQRPFQQRRQPRGGKGVKGR
jgi:hypothetical protein